MHTLLEFQVTLAVLRVRAQLLQRLQNGAHCLHVTDVWSRKLLRNSATSAYRIKRLVIAKPMCYVYANKSTCLLAS